MLTAKLGNNRVFASQVDDRKALYICPVCKEAVVLKKGKIKIHHFAHKRDSECDWENETQAHMKAKLDFFNYFKNLGCESDIEVVFPNSRADVYAESNNQKMIIEIQHSNLSKSDIADRTANYYREIPDVAVNWISVINIDSMLLKKGYTTSEGYFFPKYSPRQFERWLSDIYPSSLWFYDPMKQLLYHGEFTTVDLEIPETDFGGGYSRKSKKWVNLNLMGGYALNTLELKIEFKKIYHTEYDWEKRKRETKCTITKDRVVNFINKA